VIKIGPGAQGSSVGDQVFAMADNTYAELCVINVAVLAKIPKGLDLIRAAALPLVTVTGNRLSSATSADQVVATDDEAAIANLPPLDAVADTVGGKTAEKLIPKVKPGGVFATVLKAPQNAAQYSSVKVAPVFSKFDRKTLEFMAEAVRDGKLVIPISQILPLSEAAPGSSRGRKGWRREDLAGAVS